MAPRARCWTRSRRSRPPRRAGTAFELSTRPTSIQTASGADGVLEGFKTPRSEGLIAAFVFGDTGLQVQVVGAPAQLADRSQEIQRMISSIRQEASAR